MKSTHNHNLAGAILIGIMTFLGVMLLVYIDKDTQEFLDVFRLKAVFGWFMYSIPSFIFSFGLFRYLIKKRGLLESALVGSILGIPATISTIIVFFLLVRWIF